MPGLPKAENRVLETEFGQAIGASYAWNGGQYCAIHTQAGVVGCGIYDIACADEFGMAFALAKGTPQRPLCEPEDLLDAQIVRVSRRAAELGIEQGMTGLDALKRMMAGE